MTRSTATRGRRLWSSLAVLLLVVAASTLQSARLSVCHSDCCALFAFTGHESPGGFRSDGLASGPVSEASSCCSSESERVGAARAKRVDSVSVDAVAAGSCCCASDRESRRDARRGDEEPAPLGSLDAGGPSCCSVLEVELEPGVPESNQRDGGDPIVLQPAPVVLRLTPRTCTPHHVPFGRAPPRPDRVSALRACTVLLI